MGPSKRNKSITDRQRRRMDIITREIGCVPCRIKHGEYRPAECNHLLSGSGGYRKGHEFTVPECEWHHRGLPISGVTEDTMFRLLGPSRALHKKQFLEAFGSDDRLLEITEKQIDAFEAKMVRANAS